jgi:hypothetical protein
VSQRCSDIFQAHTKTGPKEGAMEMKTGPKQGYMTMNDQVVFGPALNSKEAMHPVKQRGLLRKQRHTRK